MYTAYVLTDASRETLKEKFPPKYSNFMGHHVTVDFGVSEDALLPVQTNLRVLGYKDSEDGLEVLIVSVNGTKERPDGNMYHITWSLESDKYKPKDSNELIKNYMKKWKMNLPFSIDAEPNILA